jgi:hypothetical protein
MPSVHHLNGFSLVRKIVYCLVLLLFIALQTHHLIILGNIQKSILMYREPNITNIDYRMYINIPQEHCRCNVISSDICLTNLRFKYSYILPLILSILEVYIFKDILLIRYRRYFLENVYWIFSIFLFLYLSIIIYRSSYYYYLTCFILSCFGILLYWLV